VKIPASLICALLGFAALGSSLSAETSTAPAPAQPAHDHTELGERMSALSRAFKKLRLQVADPAKNEDSLQLAATIRENAEASLQLEPEKTADLPEADRAKFKADFVARMKTLLADIAKLETALHANDNPEAEKIVQALADAQKEGHKEFRRKKKS
jgi:hypothetical protein